MNKKGEKHLAPLCKCGTPLYLTIGYTGADWETVAGDESGYGYEVSLVCENCNSLYPVCNLKEDDLTTRPDTYRNDTFL